MNFTGDEIKRHRGWFLLLVPFVFVTIVVRLWPAREAPPASVIIMNQPYAIPPAKVGFLDRFMPTSKAWAPLWQLRYAILGRNKGINIEGTIIDFTGSKRLEIVDLMPGRPDFERLDGLRVWRLDEGKLKELRQRCKGATDEQILASPRVTTGDGAQAGLFCGQSLSMNGQIQQVGCSVNLLPRIRGSTTDLTAVFLYSEMITNQTFPSVDAVAASSVSIQTNSAFAGRFQLPKESAGIFVLQSVPRLANQKQIGLLLSCKVLGSKK